MDDDSLTLASEPPGAGRVIAGRYHVRRRLGRGSSKDVYLAYDARLDREVAIALVVGAADGTTARARLEREARITGRLGDHPNIVTVYDTTEADGVPCLVLRALPGGSLADALQRGRLEPAQALRVGHDVAAALAHAHAHGVIHRDVKPGNVWLTADGGAALGDFGIALEPGAERLTAAGVVLGTVRYVSPEQVRGAEIGPASDLYALGITLYELVTGAPPFTAAEPQQVLAAHLSATPVPPAEHEPSIPPALDALIAELLDKDPARRPRSAARVAERLAAIDPLPAQDARRMVAVLAARGATSDPEVLHGALGHAAVVLERHGGSVDHRLGDLLVGLFALTDAHRAARAALELPALRVGLEAGEVFVAGGTATGAAIAAASRLAERAATGEVLLGPEIRAALPGASLERGRLLELREPSLLGRPDTPFVGRQPELEALELAFAQAAAERVCRLVTVTGTPGIGKSRLAAEFTTALGERSTVLAGRCPPRGEGTAYQPLIDMLGDDPRARVEALLAGDGPAVRALLGALGLSAEPVPAEEIAWALRRALERIAHERPLVVVVEDVHWAEPALLEALDHVVALSSGSPILVVCLARPELLEARPDWAAPQRNRVLLLLDALGEADALALARALGAGEPAERIARRAEGNPLFVEQLVAVGPGTLPASIQAVLAARIDGLEATERDVLQRASVEGRTFHAGALARREVGASLVALVRKGLIAPDRPAFAGEEAFRFAHALIREAAYAGVSKRARAERHASVAAWLERHAAADAVVAHHLERACHLGTELGQIDPELAARAVERLGAAAQAALGRGDPAAAAALLERAAALTGDDSLAPALGAALGESGQMAAASRVLDAAIARATEPGLRARAQVEREFVRLETETSAGTEPAERAAGAALAVLAGEDPGRCRAWSLRAQVAWIAGQVAEADAAWVEAAACAPDERQRFAIAGWRATAAVLGPLPVPEAIERCEAFRTELGVSPVAVAWAINPLASLHAMRGEFTLARRLLRDANDTLRELGSLNASVNHHEALVYLLAGEPERAEAALRPAVATLAEMGGGGLLATTSAMLAQALYAQGRFEAAGDACEVAARAGAADDLVTQVLWRGVMAKVLARAGEGERGEALAREALALAEPTDLLAHRADAMLDLGEVLRLRSRDDEAALAIRRGLALHERKGNLARLGQPSAED